MFKPAACRARLLLCLPCFRRTRDRAPTPQPLTNHQGHRRGPRGEPPWESSQASQCSAQLRRPGSCLPAPMPSPQPGLALAAEHSASLSLQTLPPRKQRPRPCPPVPEVQTGPADAGCPAPVAQQSGPGDKASVETVAAWDRGETGHRRLNHQRQARPRGQWREGRAVGPGHLHILRTSDINKENEK